MIKGDLYTTQLQAGLGLVEETKTLLSLYEPGMTVNTLHEKALQAGSIPMVTARRLRNIIAECFAPRYLKVDVAIYLQRLVPALSSKVLSQFLLVFTSLANKILFDFVIEVYWNKYSSGHDSISRDDAQVFIRNAVMDGKTKVVWSESTIKRLSSYLIGCCADYGLVSNKRSASRQLVSTRVHENTILFFVYWLHFSDLGDNSIINHDIWKLFGLEPIDVREELKSISRKGWMIVQSAGDVTRISWSFNSMEEVIDVIIKG